MAARCCRTGADPAVAVLGGRPRPRGVTAVLCFLSRRRSWSPAGWCLADTRQPTFGRLNIGQLSGDLFAVGIEARQSLPDLASPD